MQDVDHTLVAFGLDQIVNIEIGFAKKLCYTVVLQSDQASLYGSDAGRRNISVVGGVFLCIVSDFLQRFLQILEVDDCPFFVLGYFENDGQHSRLCVVEVQQPTQQ